MRVAHFPVVAHIPVGYVIEDIKTYIRSELEYCSGRKSILRDPELKAEIVSTLENGAGGMFMWVHLQILAICREETPRDVKDALSTLPKGLDETYFRIIDKISKTGGTGAVRAAHTVLKWILYAEELVSSETMIGALAVMPGEDSPDTFRWTLETILHVCHNLVVYDQELCVLRFAHFSVQEFLLSPEFSLKYPGFNGEDAHTTIAEVCLTVLTYQSEIQRDLKPAVIKYSTVNWGPHVRLSGGGSLILEGLWKEFLTSTLTPSEAFKTWQSNVVREERADRNMKELLVSGDVVHPLFIACYYRLFNIFKFLAESEATLDWRSGNGQTALAHAAENGYNDFVRFLVGRQNVDLNSRGIEGQTPLLRAAENGHRAVVEVLLRIEGVDPNSRNNYGATPLLKAACEGHRTVVEVLLANDLVDPGSRDFYGCTPLHRAASEGYRAVVTVLLANERVDPDPRCSDGCTPLSWAARSGEEAVVEVLLASEGVDPNSRDNDGRTPLSWAAKSGQRAVVEVLLRTEGVEPDPRDNKGRTPLLRAMKRGYKPVVEVLLGTEGVDLNSRDDEGRTPLWYAAMCGNQRAVEVLLASEGVDPDSRGSGGQTPLALASREMKSPWNGDYYAKVVEMLLGKAVDPESQDDEGRTPFSWLPNEERYKFTRQLMLKKIEENRTLGKNSYLPVRLTASEADS